ncbi:hypothetical protein KFK09_020926 [Dendrobium nobile]|uniref:Cytochrome P450 n=1 Tax=Dendrobium nobile TaxID=94219 RepID=A0A8T3AN08_DENNO|nr:hypothetical protein KFK09_020926 [Dendrobium nobile]
MEVLYTSLFLISLIILFLMLKISHAKQRGREPPGPWNLPILGSLHRVVGRQPPHHSFRNLSAVYGPIMRLKLGEIQAVIISSAEAAREILKTHEIYFASRPVNDSVNAIFYNANNILFGCHGEFWREMRRLCTMELLSTKRVRSFRAVREEEVSHLVEFLASSSGDLVNISSKMAETGNNIMARAAIGGRCDDQKMFLSALGDAVEFLSGFTIVDLFPSMPFIGRITGFRHRLEQCQKTLDLMAEKIVEEHREKRAKRFSENDDQEEDLTDVLLRVQREDSLQFTLSDDNIKAVINIRSMASPVIVASMKLFPASIYIFLAFLFIKSIIKKLVRHRLQSNEQVPGPKNLPIIGSIHHFLGCRPPHRALCDLSLIYGPIMRLKLGEVHTVIISSAEGAKEIMQTHDINFASRPITPTVDALFYNGKGLVFASYGEFWRQMRRICNMELLSSKCVRSFRSIISQEVSHLMRSINAVASTGVAINLSNEFANLSNNIMAISVIGCRWEDQNLFQSALTEVVESTTGFSLIDLFPSMPNFITRVAGFPQKLERCSQKLDQVLEEIVQEHIEKRARNLVQAEDLTDVLLKIQQDGNLQFSLSNDNIKAVINDILLAGSEAMATTLEWAISELVRNPKIMKKAQREVREVFGYDMTKIIGDEEWMSNKLSYLQLVIKETLRLHTPAPLLVPRENKEKCKVMGYDIPLKTMVIVNAWAIARDPMYWDKPEVFWPERFEENDIDMKGAHFEMIPFGAGRRICPGMHFGLATIEMALAHLLYYFDWEYPAKNGEELDMSEAFGIAIRRKTPLCLFATPSIPFSGALEYA